MTNTEVVLLVILLAAQLDFVIGTFIGPTDDKNLARGFVGYRKEVFYRNIQSAYGPSGIEAKDQDFFSVFGIFFPAVTGIVAGANFSGDLKDPSSAIPKGTLAAVVLTYISYIGYALMLAGCEVREASGEVSELDKNLTNILESIDLANGDSKTTTRFPHYLYPDSLVASEGHIVDIVVTDDNCGFSVVSFDLWRMLRRHALFSNCQSRWRSSCVPANLNAVAALVVNFFLAAYALINFSVFHASITKAPGWRPSFKYYNAWLSLLGTIISVVVMFMIQWDVALATLGVTISLYLLVQYRKPEANWGSSTQAQIYSTALKNTHELNKTAEHVKNYRPQLLVLAGPPSSRPPLLDFAYLITKSYSLLVVGHVVKGRMRHSERSSLIHKGYAWLQRHGIKSFYDIAESDRFDLGAKSLLQLSGLGKLRPNILLLGFKADWGSCDPSQTLQYFNVIHDAFDNHTAVGILRVEEGLDYSEVLEEEPLSYVENKVLKNVKTETSLGEMGEESNSSSASVTSGDNPSTNETENKTQKKEKETKNKAKQKQPSQIYRRPDGAALPKTVINNLTQFQQKQKKDARIDVWWLYDDGGLTILLPYILTQRSQFSSASLRIFCLASSNELEKEQRSMAALLSKFRIDYSDVVIISDFKKKAAPELYQEFDALIEPFKEKSGETREPGTYIPDAELMATQNKNSRHVKLRELLLYHSIDASLIVMTLPMPRKGMVSAPLYMAWLDTLTKGMPPFLALHSIKHAIITLSSIQSSSHPSHRAVVLFNDVSPIPIVIVIMGRQ
ncbi:unnamed protein product [Darwinula stevensoni]|uniref:Uncharacterized protein n=1 Tax=Darwinula stevensoni TaxID=69355 RepID=A0A7R9A764_9CRUS|nr:unnamed protein product [Darwinula stevensoni]CAG0891817.1 unnamed protein product [Darwinula stevensoni]